MSSRILEVDLAFDALTDVGLKRSGNEDSVLASPPVFLVADGIGGHESGELASQAVVDGFASSLHAGDGVSLADVSKAVESAIRRVSDIASGGRRSAGSTASGVVLLEHLGEPFWLVFNVGDSRVYRLFGARLEQLTKDHTVVQEQVDSGELTAVEAESAEGRNVLTRAIGAPDARVDSWLMPVTTGERLLICSDGLYGEVDHHGICEILLSAGSPTTTVNALISAAKSAGGRDNISAVVIDVRGGGTGLDPANETTAPQPGLRRNGES